MASALRLCHLHFGMDCGSKRFDGFQISCNSSRFPSEGAEDSQSQFSGEESQAKIIFLENYSNGTSKRYVVESDSRIRTVLLEERLPGANVSRDSAFVGRGMELAWLPKAIKDFILPAGFPDSVSDDYLEYIILQFPTNVTGWICHTLVTSSLLKAVGVGSFSGSTAAISAATIRWVSKDGIGALGRLFIGSITFNDNWRYYTYKDTMITIYFQVEDLELSLMTILNNGAYMQTLLVALEGFLFCSSCISLLVHCFCYLNVIFHHSIFDLTTQLYPAYFLPLASVGNLAKAVGRGLRDPSFRVIQNHFAISGNLGEVSAKEEVWEVAAELVGIGLGILALDTPDISSSYPTLVSTWLGMRLLHLWLRYLSLSVLRFNTINFKRARILVNSHVLLGKVLGVNDCNKMEDILLWERFTKPKIIFGVPLEEMITGKRCGFMLRMLLKVYAEEKYILLLNEQKTEFEVFVSYKEGATSLSVLRSVWQSYWLHRNWSKSIDVFLLLEQSLMDLKDRFDDFLLQLEANGWDTEQINLKVSKEISIHEHCDL